MYGEDDNDINVHIHGTISLGKLDATVWHSHYGTRRHTLCGVVHAVDGRCGIISTESDKNNPTDASRRESPKRRAEEEQSPARKSQWERVCGGDWSSQSQHDARVCVYVVLVAYGPLAVVGTPCRYAGEIDQQRLKAPTGEVPRAPTDTRATFANGRRTAGDISRRSLR